MATILKKEKKVVNQEELRRLMKLKQRESASKKKADSPFAKYNSLGHLSCGLCKTPVKNELLWQAHVLGKQHREKVAELKGVQQSEPSPSVCSPLAAPVPIPAVKRKAQDIESQEELKRVKAVIDDAGSSASGLLAAVSKSKGLSLLSGEYDDEEEEEEAAGKVPAPSGLNVPSGLPADFFDSSLPPAPVVSHSGSIKKADEPEKTIERKENTAEALPEGFFDDPVRDAKVRNVDTPKDQMDKEWDEFQKELRQVSTVSEAIVAEDDEEVRLDRQIGEIDEQIECYRRVEILHDRQEMLKEHLKVVVKSNPSEDEGDIDSEGEDELQDLLSRDWRAKGVLL